MLPENRKMAKFAVFPIQCPHPGFIFQFLLLSPLFLAFISAGSDLRTWQNSALALALSVSKYCVNFTLAGRGEPESHELGINHHKSLSDPGFFDNRHATHSCRPIEEENTSTHQLTSFWAVSFDRPMSDVDRGHRMEAGNVP